MATTLLKKIEKERIVIPDILVLLPVLALTVDLLIPYLSWKGYVPSTFRWISHICIAGMIAIICFRMLVNNGIPKVFIPILCLSVLGLSTAALNHQGVTATIWGWWLMFQFPLVGIFCFLQTKWPAKVTPMIITAGCGLVLFELGVQVFQYIMGQKPGDNLAGSFGAYGTGSLVILILLVICLGFGRWIVSHNWKLIAFLLGISYGCSLLGEMKLFLFAAIAIGAVACVLYVIYNKDFVRPFIIILAIGVMGFAFLKLYSLVIPESSTLSFIGLLNNPEAFMKYLNFSDKTVVNGMYVYDMGRNRWVEYAWQSINGDITTLLFGFGLGSRSESQALGLAGSSLITGGLGLNTGTTLVVLLQEIGLVGMTLLGLFFLWVVGSLLISIKRHPRSNLTEIRLGLILFTLFFPLWLWYNTVWILRVPMLLYWALLGYVMNPNVREMAGEIVLQGKKRYFLKQNPLKIDSGLREI